MRKLAQQFALGIFVMLSTAYSCHSQNGPSPQQAVATWAQAVPTATSGPVTANSVYRCATPACTPAPPAIYTSTTPVTVYTDTSIVAGTTYIYSVTAHFGVVEGPYSNNSAPYSWAYTAPAIPVVTGSLVPQAQAQDVVARTPSERILRHGIHTAVVGPSWESWCGSCTQVSALVVKSTGGK
jgi:hypothetical protein